MLLANSRPLAQFRAPSDDVKLRELFRDRTEFEDVCMVIRRRWGLPVDGRLGVKVSEGPHADRHHIRIQGTEVPRKSGTECSEVACG